ncbi:hypothetical protein EPN44_03750 [bacterium]|nr:MAG: hypothetical protein EPN44_03750 [bacterium]
MALSRLALSLPCVCLLVAIATGCSSGAPQGSGHTPVALPSPLPATSVRSDDWAMQSHNPQRNGFQGETTGLSSGTASRLALRWANDFGAPITASPLAVGGRIYIATEAGQVAALDAASGNVLWNTTVPGPVHATPTLDGSILIVGVYIPGSVVALNAANGSVLWQTPVTAWGAIGSVRTEPLVANGTVYVGSADGDPPDCNPGTLAALSEATGAPMWSWRTAQPGQGVAVWSPISLAPNGDVLFGTGNSCGDFQYAESVIALNGASGAFDWQAMTLHHGPDIDVGGGVAEAGGLGFFTGKNGYFYAIGLADGAQVWQISLGSDPGYGSIATPATDGVNVVTQSGALTDADANASPGSRLYDYGLDGSLRWSAGPFAYEEFSSPAITADVVVTGIDNTLQVRSLSSGALLWSYDTGSFVYASPAVVPSGVYITSTGGKAFAFGVGAGTSAVVRRVGASTRSAPRWHPWHDSR